MSTEVSEKRPYCVTSTPTICDGTVLRWYGSETAMTFGNEAISASRNGVMGHGSCLTPELFEQAWEAHLELKAGRDVARFVTHRSLGLFSREYEPVAGAR